jgi:hypothetical protein
MHTDMLFWHYALAKLLILIFVFGTFIACDEEIKPPVIIIVDG